MPAPRAAPARKRENVRRIAYASSTHVLFRQTSATLSAVIVELAAATPSTALSVSDIVRQAEINRSTFYTHAESPMALLSSVMRASLARTASPLGSGAVGRRAPLETALIAVVDHVDEHRVVYRTALRDPAAAGALFHGITEHLTTRFEAIHPTASVEVRAAVAAACTEVIRRGVAAPSPTVEIAGVLAVLDIVLAPWIGLSDRVPSSRAGR